MAKYDPRLAGADCDNCPFYDKEEFRPVAPKIMGNAKFIIINEHQSEADLERGASLCGRAGQVLEAELSKVGLSKQDASVVSVIACKGNLAQDSVFRKAYKACAPRFKKDFESAKLAAPKSATLAMGKWSGIAACGAKAKHHRGILKDRIMVTDSANMALLLQPQRAVVLRSYLERFAGYVNHGKWTKWPKPVLVPGKEALRALRKMAAHDKPVGFDVETLGTDPLTCPITCFGLSDGTHTISMPWDTYDTKKHGYVRGIDEYGKLGKEIRRLCIDIVTNPRREIVTQNGNYDILSFSSKGIEIKNGFDTMHAHAVAFPELGGHGLEEIAAHMLTIPTRWKSGFHASDEDLKGSALWAESDPLVLREYNSQDALVTLLLREPLIVAINQRDNGWEIYQNALRNADIALRMYLWGWKLDPEEKAALDANFSSWISNADRRFNALLEKVREDLSEEDLNTSLSFGATKKRKTVRDLFSDFNSNSDGCLRALMYGLLGEEPPSFTDTGNASVSAAAMKELVHSDNQLVRLFAGLRLRLKRYRKLKESYIDNLGEETIIRANVNVSRQISGRWSTTRPALTTANPRIKSMFITRPGNWIVGADFAALEAYVVALSSGEDRLIDLFQDPTRDVHKENAAALFGIKVENVQDWQRQAAKTFLYASLYGADNDDALAMSLWEKLREIKHDISYNVVRGAVERWWRLVPKVRQYQKDLISRAYREHLVQEPFNKRARHYFGSPPKINKQEVKNFPCQAGGAAIADRAIQGIDSRLRHGEEGLLLQQHDGFYIEVPDPVRGAEILRDSLIQTRELDGKNLTFVCDYSVGKSWGFMRGAETVEEVAEITNWWDFRERKKGEREYT